MFVIPTIEANLKRDGSIRFSALTIAAWCYYSDKGVDRQNRSLEIVDKMKTQLHEAARRTTEDKLSFLKLKSVFGELANNEQFARTYSELVDEVYENPNVARLMRRFMADG